MFHRFNWLTFDPSLFHEDPHGRTAKAAMLGTTWSVWTEEARRYRERFESGDENAIVEFARSSNGIFLTPWVIRAIRKWQAEGTASGKKKIRKVISNWLDSRGKNRPDDLFKFIRRDKQIFSEVLRNRIKGSTVEVAVATVADKREMPEDTVREIHRKYAHIKRRVNKSDQEFLAYLKAADPAEVWTRVTDSVDAEQTVLFLYLEVDSMIRRKQVSFDDLYPGWPVPGHFFESLVRATQNGQKVTLNLSRVRIDEGAAAHPAVAPGEYLRVDVHRGTGPTGPQPDDTVFWEQQRDHFLFIHPTSAAWYENLKTIH